MGEELNIEEICSKHEQFLLNELRPRLFNFVQVQNEIKDEIKEYHTCQMILEEMREKALEGVEKYESLVDIGEGNYVQSQTNQCETIYIHVGMGFHVEVDLDWAKKISEDRINILEKKVTNLNTTIELVGQDIQEVN